jgi:hypothetical protein
VADGHDPLAAQQADHGDESGKLHGVQGARRREAAHPKSFEVFAPERNLTLSGETGLKPEDNADMERFARALARTLEPLEGYGSAKKVLTTTRPRRAPAM